MCPEWRGEGGFQKFYNHVGQRPGLEYSLDRINNDGNYEPANVRWATQPEQCGNRRKYGTLEYFTTEELMAELRRRGKNVNSG
jgi:hypothetical protein